MPLNLEPRNQDLHHRLLSLSSERRERATTPSVAYDSVLVLHHQPPAAPLHHNESPDLSLVLAFVHPPIDSVGRIVCTDSVDYRHNRRIWSGKANRHVLDGYLDTFEYGAVRFLQFLEHGLTPTGPPTERIDVVPVFRGILR